MAVLENAVALLKLFGPDRQELTVTNSAILSGMPKSSVGRLMSDMRSLGLLESHGQRPHYRIGPLFFEIARQYQPRTSLSALAEAKLAAVCRQIGHTGYVSVLQGADVLVVRVCPGTQALQVVTPLGQRLPAWETAIGRSLLSRLTDDAVRAIYKGYLKPSNRNSPQTVDALIAGLEQVRRRGCAEALNEAIPGVGSTAVALKADTEMLGICLSYSALIRKSEKAEIARLLVEAAADIGVEVGDQYWEARGRNIKQRRSGSGDKRVIERRRRSQTVSS